MSSTPSGAPRQLPRRGSLSCGSAPSPPRGRLSPGSAKQGSGSFRACGRGPCRGRNHISIVSAFRPRKGDPMGETAARFSPWPGGGVVHAPTASRRVPSRGMSRGTFRKVPRAILWFLSHRGERNAPRRAALPVRRIGIKQKDILFMSRLSLRAAKQGHGSKCPAFSITCMLTSVSIRAIFMLTDVTDYPGRSGSWREWYCQTGNGAS